MVRRRVRRVCPDCHQRVAVTFRARRLAPVEDIPAACVAAPNLKDAI